MPTIIKKALFLQHIKPITMFTLKARDFLKGLLLAVLTPILTIIVNSSAAGTLELNWKQIGVTAIGTMAAYLLKNLFTDDVKQAQKVLIADAEKKNVAPAAPNDSELLNNKNS